MRFSIFKAMSFFWYSAGSCGEPDRFPASVSFMSLASFLRLVRVSFRMFSLFPATFLIIVFVIDSEAMML